MLENVEHLDEQVFVGSLPDDAKAVLIDCYFKGDINPFLEKMKGHISLEDFGKINDIANYNLELKRTNNESMLISDLQPALAKIDGYNEEFSVTPSMLEGSDIKYRTVRVESNVDKRKAELEALKQELTLVTGEMQKQK